MMNRRCVEHETIRVFLGPCPYTEIVESEETCGIFYAVKVTKSFNEIYSKREKYCGKN